MKAFSAFVLALIPTFAQAATYYVDRSHPQASDFNPGTEAAPWKTIQHAANTLVAGDIAYVKAGVYAERILLEIPNVTLPAVPAGGEEANRVVKEWGTPRREDGLRPHWEIGAAGSGGGEPPTPVGT